ncbi:MAG: hypothetical protein M1827_003935 [Pycnora praestabilis]|nr:MAG: hypothetical protein M1827_003935 [Pycnora praestabilis]
METAVKTFFSSPRFAVAMFTNSATNRSIDFFIVVLAWYHAHSLPVTPINPRNPTINLPSTTYSMVPNVSALPSPQETSVSVITPPAATLKVLKEAKEAGIPAVWLQPGSFDEEGLEYAKREFKAGVGGEGGGGGEGWCVLVDGEEGLSMAGKNWKKQKL